jgi:tryptophan-rich sensory protein
MISSLYIYRLLRHSGDVVGKQAALTLIVALMTANALWNYVFFRAQNLRLSFAVNVPYLGLAIALFACLVQINQAATWSLAPYLMYQGYALWWGYSLWKINDRVE